jgi:hypothetical protein
MDYYSCVKNIKISSSYPVSAASPLVPLVASFRSGPKVAPLSLLILATGSSLIAFRSHQVTITLSPSAAISTSCDSVLVLLLRFILSAKVAPPSVEALN